MDPSESAHLVLVPLLLRECVHRLLCPESHFILAPASFAGWVPCLVCIVEVGLCCVLPAQGIYAGSAEMAFGVCPLLSYMHFTPTVPWDGSSMQWTHLIVVVHTNKVCPGGPNYWPQYLSGTWMASVWPVWLVLVSGTSTNICFVCVDSHLRLLLPHPAVVRAAKHC